MQKCLHAKVSSCKSIFLQFYPLLQKCLFCKSIIVHFSPHAILYACANLTATRVRGNSGSKKKYSLCKNLSVQSSLLVQFYLLVQKYIRAILYACEILTPTSKLYGTLRFRPLSFWLIFYM